MRSEFENSIKWSSSYEKLVYQHGERLFIFDDGKYKIAAVQLAWAIFKEKQAEVDELQKRVDASLIAFEKLKDEINELHGQCDLHLIKYLEEKAQVLEQALKGGIK